MVQDLDWNDLRLVATLARHPTLADASAELDVDPSTVWRRLKRLEGRLGLALFERGRRYAPTPAGELLLAHARRVEDEVHGFVRALEGRAEGPVGLVRLTLPETFLPLTAPILAGLLETCPGLRLEIDTSPLALDLDRNEAHVALRASRVPPESAVARRIAEVAWGVWAHPDAPDRWVAYDSARSNVPAVQRRLHRDPEPVLRVPTVEAMRIALHAGLGRGLLPSYLATGLRAVEPPDPRDHTVLWALYHPDHRRVERVRTVVDALVAGLGAHASLFADVRGR